AERLGDALEAAAAGEDRSALAHRQMVRRIETLCGQVAECACLAAAVGCAQGVAIVLHQVQIVALHEIEDRIEVEGIAEGVGQHEALCSGREGRDEARGGRGCTRGATPGCGRAVLPTWCLAPQAADRASPRGSLVRNCSTQAATDSASSPCSFIR